MDDAKILGQYEIIEAISHGSITSVYKAYQPSLKRTVLIKRLHQQLVNEVDIRERFAREAQVCAQISHPNIVSVFDFQTSPDATYLVMEYIAGKNLTNLMANEALPLDVALAIMFEILKGLQFAHEQGVVHRDIKPDNILISTNGEVKISDFGLAILEGATTLTQQGMVVGTPAYMSPEQAAGKKLDLKSDIFSLGISFFEMLTGVSIYKSDSLTQCIQRIISEPPPRLADYRTDLPIQLDKVLSKMLEKKSNKRHSSCAEIADELSSCELRERKIPEKEVIREFYNQRDKVASTGLKAGTTTSRRRFRRKTAVYIITSFTVLIAFLILFFFIPLPLIKNVKLPVSKVDSLMTQEKDKTKMEIAEEKSGAMQIDDISEKNSKAVVPQPNLTVENKRKFPSDNAKFDTESLRKIPEVSTENIKDLESNLSALNKEAVIDNTPALVTISCYPWADVQLDNRILGQPPFAKPFEVSPGEHTLLFLRPDYPLVSRTIKVKPGEKIAVEVNLWCYLGVLKISTVNTWAEIWVDGEFLDRTPRADPLILPLGKHLIELKNPAFKTWSKEYNFIEGAGEPQLIAVTMEPLIP